MRSEFEFINEIRSKFDLKFVGDDCAVLPKNRTHDMLITSDLVVEDVDFRQSWMIPAFLGHKALAISLSDIGAMGGTPLYSMLSIGIPEVAWRSGFVDEFYDGYFKLAELYEVQLIGGDVSKTADRIVIDSIVVGEVERNKAVLRSGAKVGDSIFVSGQLGGAGAGLRMLENGASPATATGWSAGLIERQLRPMPRIRSPHSGVVPRALPGEAIEIINSMIDISDGLSSDLMHICRASGVGARIYSDKIPLHSGLTYFTESFDERLSLALNGGEDFELLFTADPKKLLQLEMDDCANIGEVTPNNGIIELISNQKTTLLEPKGYEHF